jgi:pyruvate/2-oxoglutarate dehydrogenase complex dihydrolipoamide acyltransferase (E2) component
MSAIPIIMPQLGESIAEATIVRLLVDVGQPVSADQDLIEVETSKATMNVTSPCSGKLREWIGKLGESYPVGAVLGALKQIEKKRPGSESIRSAPKEARRQLELKAHIERSVPGDHSRKTVQPTVRGLPVPANAEGISYMSPRMKARMAELGLHAADLAGLPGSGAGGRVTIQDFERFIAGLQQHNLSKASTMRVAVADAMRRSWTRPLATVALPVCFDPILKHRKTCEPKPGPALYALRAFAIALGENSAPAGRLIGSQIVHPQAIDLGFAVEASDGVLVPVIRSADRSPLATLVPLYNRLIELAHQRKLPADATGGSIATVTNFGTFGLTWATPIPLPEQTLVLGMGGASRAELE